MKGIFGTQKEVQNQWCHWSDSRQSLFESWGHPFGILFCPKIVFSFKKKYAAGESMVVHRFRNLSRHKQTPFCTWLQHSSRFVLLLSACSILCLMPAMFPLVSNVSVDDISFPCLFNKWSLSRVTASSYFSRRYMHSKREKRSLNTKRLV